MIAKREVGLMQVERVGFRAASTCRPGPGHRRVVGISGSFVVLGQAASAAAVLLAAGTPGKRMALPHARVLLHQPYGGAMGQAADIELAAKEILRMREILEMILSRHTGQTTERISKDTDRDFVMSAEQAKEYGIIDEVISSREIVDRSGPIAAVR